MKFQKFLWPRENLNRSAADTVRPHLLLCESSSHLFCCCLISPQQCNGFAKQSDLQRMNSWGMNAKWRRNFCDLWFFFFFALFSLLMSTKLFLLIFCLFGVFFALSHHLNSPPCLPACPLSVQPLGREANPPEGDPEPAQTCCKSIAAPPRWGFPSFANCEGNKSKFLAPRLRFLTLIPP